MNGIRRRGWAALAVAALGSAAGGAVVMPTSDAAIRIDRDNAPAVLATPGVPYAWTLWVRPTAAPATTAHLVDAAGVLEMLVEPAGRKGGTDLVARLRNGAATLEVALPLGGPLPLDEWVLLGASWDPGPGIFSAWARAESLPPMAATVVDPAFDPATLLAPMSIGRPDEPGAATLVGRYGTLVFRDHAMIAADVDHIFDARDYVGAYRLDNTDTGGTLDESGGVSWMAQHAILTKPDPVGNPLAEAALPGGPVTVNNYPIYDAGVRGSSVVAGGVVASVTGGADQPTWESPFDFDAFFQRQIPDMPIPDVARVAGVSPLVRSVARDEPEGIVRCLVSANSRGVNIATASGQTWPGNYAHGFIEAQRPIVAGIVNRPAWKYSGVPWFGFDTTQAPRVIGSVTDLSSGGNHRGFKRCWTGSSPTTTGPGPGVIMQPGATYSLKCRPEPGTLLIAEAPLVVRSHFLRFPGAGVMSWRPEKSTGQSIDGTIGAETVVDLSMPTTFTHTYATGDFVNFFTGQMTFVGSFADQINPGDACYVSEGAGTNGFSVVESASENGGITTVQLEHGLATSVIIGSVLIFGPWDVETVTYKWPALAPDDPATWRGLRLTASAGPVVHFAVDAWRPDAGGVVYGTAGWGGNGYVDQIGESFDGAMARWMSALAPDIWFQCFAQQSNAPASMSLYLAQIRAALPATEVAWLGDGVHLVDKTSSWHEYILDEAANAGVLASTVVRQPTLGSYIDQASDALRQDAAHINQRGNTRLAELWLADLRDAALLAGDIDGDGVVDVNDLVTVIANWGACPAPPSTCIGDTDGDGIVDVNDLVAVITDWGG